MWKYSVVNKHLKYSLSFMKQLLFIAYKIKAIKNPPTVPETWVRSLGWEDPLEEAMATHSNILVWNPHG